MILVLLFVLETHAADSNATTRSAYDYYDWSPVQISVMDYGASELTRAKFTVQTTASTASWSRLDNATTESTSEESAETTEQNPYAGIILSAEEAVEMMKDLNKTVVEQSRYLYGVDRPDKHEQILLWVYDLLNRTRRDGNTTFPTENFSWVMETPALGKLGLRNMAYTEGNPRWVSFDTPPPGYNNPREYDQGPSGFVAPPGFARTPPDNQFPPGFSQPPPGLDLAEYTPQEIVKKQSQEPEDENGVKKSPLSYPKNIMSESSTTGFNKGNEKALTLGEGPRFNQESPGYPPYNYGPTGSPLYNYGPTGSPLYNYGPTGSPLYNYGPTGSPLYNYGPTGSPLYNYGPTGSPLYYYGPTAPAPYNYGPTGPPPYMYGPSSPPPYTYGPTGPPAYMYGPMSPPSYTYGPTGLPPYNYGSTGLLQYNLRPDGNISPGYDPKPVYNGKPPNAMPELPEKPENPGGYYGYSNAPPGYNGQPDLPIHNQGLPIYNQGPQIHNQGPPIYNQGPPIHNQGPPIYNQGPPIYNQGPPMYNQGPQRYEAPSGNPDPRFGAGQGIQIPGSNSPVGYPGVTEKPGNQNTDGNPIDKIQDVPGQIPPENIGRNPQFLGHDPQESVTLPGVRENSINPGRELPSSPVPTPSLGAAELMNRIPSTTSATEAVRIMGYVDLVETTPDHSFLDSVKGKMVTGERGYFYVFLEKLFQLMATKEKTDAAELIQGLEMAFEEATRKRMFLDFGSPFNEATENGIRILGGVPTDVAQGEIAMAYQLLNQDINIADDFTAILKKADGMYTLKEGDDLLSSLELIQLYPQGDKTSTEVMSTIMEAFIAPLNRMTGSERKRTLIEMINQAISKRFNVRRNMRYLYKLEEDKHGHRGRKAKGLATSRVENKDNVNNKDRYKNGDKDVGTKKHKERTGNREAKRNDKKREDKMSCQVRKDCEVSKEVSVSNDSIMTEDESTNDNEMLYRKMIKNTFNHNEIKNNNRQPKTLKIVINEKVTLKSNNYFTDHGRPWFQHFITAKDITETTSTIKNHRGKSEINESVSTANKVIDKIDKLGPHLNNKKKIKAKLKRKNKGLSMDTDRDFIIEKPRHKHLPFKKHVKHKIRAHLKMKHPVLYKKYRIKHKLAKEKANIERNEHNYEKLLRNRFSQTKINTDIDHKREKTFKSPKRVLKIASPIKQGDVIEKKFITTRQNRFSVVNSLSLKPYKLAKKINIVKSKYLDKMPKHKAKTFGHRKMSKDGKESSNTDEENVLKFALQDTLRHGDRFENLRNERGRKEIFQDVRRHGINGKINDISSVSDEEGVLKNNIYKVFGNNSEFGFSRA